MTDYLGVAPLVAPRTRKSIERQAAEIVHQFYPELWAEPGPFPILPFLEFELSEHFGIDLSVDDRLPLHVEGATYPLNARGRIDIILAESVYKGLHEYNRRDRFTCAHECGHGILHAKQLKMRVLDGKQTALFRRAAVKRYYDPEWQSHVFAGALLMPTAAVQAFVKQWGADPQLLGDEFRVSRRAAGLRLHHMMREGVLAP